MRGRSCSKGSRRAIPSRAAAIGPRSCLGGWGGLGGWSGAGAWYGLALVAAVAVGCKDDPPSPFSPSLGGVGGVGGSPAGGTGGEDPTLGPPCKDDAQCDDGVECTFDRCDLEIERCRFVPDDAVCQNTVYCDGLEVCDTKLGCQAGPPANCSDENVCTLDACIEATKSCASEPRDIDQDGDPDIHCGGGDCNDLDPAISSLKPEICNNQIDDNCSGTTDEAGCVVPAHDTCADPLEINQSGLFALATIGTAFNYSHGCVPTTGGLGDAVAALLVPAGPLVDVEVTARAPFDVGLGLAEQCGDAGTALTCGASFEHPDGGYVSKLRGRNLGDAAAQSAYPLYVTAAFGADVSLAVSFSQPEPEPDNETCGTAAPLVPGTPVVADLVDAATDVATFCDREAGDLVYTFELDATYDVEIYGTSLDGDGIPSLSLRDSACALPEDEITCQTAETAHIFRHSMGPGTYALSVSASAPTDVVVSLALSPPTPPSEDETCTTAPSIQANVQIPVTLSDHQNDHELGCLDGAVDAAQTLMLSQPSDIRLVQRFAPGDDASVALTGGTCDGRQDVLTCAVASPSPVRVAAYNQPPGAYRIVSESLLEQDVTLLPLVRPAAPPTIVVFSDDCAGALAIPPTGGRFTGNTANATADFSAPCDAGGGPAGGAKDQILSLTLTSEKRVIFDMLGSAYPTLLNVRSGPTCPGTSIASACAVGNNAQRSFLDVTLPPGTHYVQIDGFGLNQGAWFLDVHVIDP